MDSNSRAKTRRPGNRHAGARRRRGASARARRPGAGSAARSESRRSTRSAAHERVVRTCARSRGRHVVEQLLVGLVARGLSSTNRNASMSPASVSALLMRSPDQRHGQLEQLRVGVADRVAHHTLLLEERQRRWVMSSRESRRMWAALMALHFFRSEARRVGDDVGDPRNTSTISARLKMSRSAAIAQPSRGQVVEQALGQVAPGRGRPARAPRVPLGELLVAPGPSRRAGGRTRAPVRCRPPISAPGQRRHLARVGGTAGPPRAARG